MIKGRMVCVLWCSEQDLNNMFANSRLLLLSCYVCCDFMTGFVSRSRSKLEKVINEPCLNFFLINANLPKDFVLINVWHATCVWHTIERLVIGLCKRF